MVYKLSTYKTLNQNNSNLIAVQVKQNNCNNSVYTVMYSVCDFNSNPHVAHFE